MYSTEKNVSDYKALDDLFLKYKSIKSSQYHDYSKIYSRFFAPIRNKKLKILEIGIRREESAKTWIEYFPNADLHFIDREEVQITSEQGKYYIVNPNVPNQLNAFILKVGADFDLIIDGGGHTSSQQITSFEVLFSYLKQGGIYAIENLSFSKGNYKDGLTTFDFLKHLLDEINWLPATWTGQGRNCNEKLPPHIREQLHLYRKSIDWMVIQSNLALITKR